MNFLSAVKFVCHCDNEQSAFAKVFKCLLAIHYFIYNLNVWMKYSSFWRAEMQNCTKRWVFIEKYWKTVNKEYQPFTFYLFSTFDSIFQVDRLHRYGDLAPAFRHSAVLQTNDTNRYFAKMEFRCQFEIVVHEP